MQMIEIAEGLRCPNCLSVLDRLPDDLLCARCDIRYPIRDEIADLRVRRKDYYFNPVSRAKMEEIIGDISPGNWPRAVRRFLAEVNFNSDWLDNLAADGRYAWKLFLDLPPGANVLDLGCGLGNLTKNIAPHVGRVWALDLTWERLQFAKRRFAVFNRRDRISVVAAGDGPHLPFAQGTFDCVVMSGVLEWVADDSSHWADASGRIAKLWKMLQAHVGQHNPARVQRRFLEEVRRVLKPSGQVFIAIENRLGYEYFAGLPDHHCGLSYASLLPRSLATLYALIRSRAPYRTYTYSYRGYARLLHRAGFAQSRFLGLAPGYSHLSEIIPFDEGGQRWSPRHADSLKDQLRASKLFVTAYGIIGSQGMQKRQASLVERIAREVEEAAGEPFGSYRLSSFKVTGKAKGIAKGILHGRRVVLRVPLNGEAAIGEQANYDALRQIARDFPALRRKAPAPIIAGSMQNVSYFVEEEACGTPLSVELCRSAPAEFLAQAGRFLGDMNPQLSDKEPACLEGEMFRRKVDEPLERLASAVENAGLMKAARQGMCELLLGARVHCGLFHGDFNPENIFVSEGKIATVIDWEYWSPVGLPILDAINFVDGCLRVANPDMGIAESIFMLAELKSLSQCHWDFLQRQYRTMGVDPARHRGMVYLYWLHHVDKQINTLALDQAAIETRVKRVLRYIAASHGNIQRTYQGGVHVMTGGQER